MFRDEHLERFDNVFGNIKEISKEQFINSYLDTIVYYTKYKPNEIKIQISELNRVIDIHKDSKQQYSKQRLKELNSQLKTLQDQLDAINTLHRYLINLYHSINIDYPNITPPDLI